MVWLFVGLSTLFSILGQLGLKYAMRRIAAQNDAARSLLVRIILSPYVIAALFVYGCGVLFWLMALSRLEVSLVYPFASLSYVGIIVASHYLFGEHVSRARVVGVGIVVIGVIVVGLSAPGV
jgi:multidrug transporter EmrE-like cation transporter